MKYPKAHRWLVAALSLCFLFCLCVILYIMAVHMASGDANASQPCAGHISSLAVIGIAAGMLCLDLFILFNHRRFARLRTDVENATTSEQQFRAVMEQSGKTVFRYDIQNDRFIGGEVLLHKLQLAPAPLENADSRAVTGMVDSASADEYRRFWERIRAGEDQLSATILCHRQDGGQGWYRFTSMTQYDDKSKPKIAIIVLSECTEERERELAYVKWQQELTEMKRDNIAMLEWNLTRNMCESTTGNLWPAVKESTPWSLDQYTAAYAERLVNEEDRATLIASMGRERLLSLYHMGMLRDSMDYRQKRPDDSFGWVNLTIQLVPYRESGEIKLYAALRDVDQEKRQALELLRKAQIDAMTGAFNRETFIQRTNELFKEKTGETHAMIMLDLDGLKLVNDTLGHDAGDQVLVTAVNAIRATLRVNDLVGRIGGDEFLICLPCIPFDSAIAKKAQELKKALRNDVTDKLTISASLGVAIYPRDGKTFDELYQKADAAVYAVKNNGGDGFVFSGDCCPDKTVKQAEVSDDALIVITNSNAFHGDVETLLGNEHRILIADTHDDTLHQLRRHTAKLTAIIVDGDSQPGKDAINALRQHSLPVFALFDDINAPETRALSKDGMFFTLSKTAMQEVLPAQLKLILSYCSTERRRFNDAYRSLQSEDEQRYREVLRATGTTVMVYDVLTETFHVDVLPEQQTTVDFSGGSLLDTLVEQGHMTQETLDEALAIVREVGAGKLPRQTFHFQLPVKGGARHWYAMQAILLDRSQAQTPKVLLTLNDVNERMTLEQLRIRVLDNLPCGAAMYEVSDHDISAVYINKRYIELVGRNGDLLHLNTALDSVHPEDSARLLSQIHTVTDEAEIISTEIRIINGSGVYAPFHFLGRVVAGLKPMLYATYYPVDNRKPDITKLLPVVLSAIMGSSADMVFAKDRQLRYICASRTFAMAIKLKDEKEIIGKTDYELFDDPAIAEQYRSDDRRLMENGPSMVNYMEPMPWPDGHIHTVLTSKFLLYDDAGEVIGIFGSSRMVDDIPLPTGGDAVG